MDFANAKLMLVNSENEESVFIPLTNIELNVNRNGTEVTITSRVFPDLYGDRGKDKDILRILGFK